jgi:6,7-dimethyl-8-ribityllumazine synthase
MRIDMIEFSGHFHGKGLRFAIVVSRFNEMITSRLLKGALDALQRHAVLEKDIAVAWVPGAFEIPYIAKKMALSNRYDAVICLGAVIKGATLHFDIIAAHSASGIAKLTQESPCPIIFGVLTTNTIEEALERAGSKSGNKGFDSAVSAIEMINLQKQIEEHQK